jgi:AraC family transcriptional regulator
VLAYLGTGPRDYAAKPVPILSRKYWEFQAIVAGDAFPTFPLGNPTRGMGRRLWVFAPACRHGWSAPPGRTCRVMVVHVPLVGEAVKRAAGASGHFSVPLDDGSAARLVALGARLADEIAVPSDRGEILHQLATAELSLLALAQTPARRLQDGPRLARMRVENACAWFIANLASGPGPEAVAAAINVSPAHLRRLFQQVRGASPREVLDGMRYQMAGELLADPDRRLEDIAAICGFSAASALSRGFRAHTGLSPQAWRRQRLHPPSIQRPVPAGR